MSQIQAPNLLSFDSSRNELEGWIEAANRGDREALGRALHSFRAYLLLVANNELEPALKAKEGASDLVQETFLLAQCGVEKFRGRTEAEWREWLRSILMNQLINHRRKWQTTAKRQLNREVAIDGSPQRDWPGRDISPGTELVRREREVALLVALERLPQSDRELVIAHQRDGLTFEEIGRRQGITAEAARKRWTRALNRLSKEIGPAHDSR
jgi:RNA polymerase sigma-70 factor, ECF subfamily